MAKEAALVVGAGPRLGGAIARRLVKGGRKVAESSRPATRPIRRR